MSPCEGLQLFEWFTYSNQGNSVSETWEHYIILRNAHLLANVLKLCLWTFFHILHDSCGIRNVCVNVHVFERTWRIQLCWILEAKSLACLAVSIHSSTFGSTESKKRGEQKTICLFCPLTICVWSILRPQGLCLCMSVCVILILPVCDVTRFAYSLSTDKQFKKDIFRTKK